MRELRHRRPRSARPRHDRASGSRCRSEPGSPSNPLITPDDVPPSQPGMEVISTINAGAARVGDEVVLLLRVAERPSTTGELPPGARLVNLSGDQPTLEPMQPGLDLERSRRHAVLRHVGRPAAHRARPTCAATCRAWISTTLARSATATSPTVTSATRRHRLPHPHVAPAGRPKHRRRATSRSSPSRRCCPASELEAYGVEDPRVTEIDGVFRITYVSVSRLGITTSLLSTSDFRTFERGGRHLACPTRRTSCCSPSACTTRYLAFTRPMPGSLSRILGIWLAESPDLAALGQAPPGRPAAPRHVGRGADRREPHPVPGRRRLARGLPRRRSHEPLRHGRDAARCRRPVEGARPLVPSTARARARVRAFGVPARRGVPERTRDARRRSASASTTAPPTRPWRPPTSRSRTSSPTSIRAEAARAAHPPAAGRRRRRARRRRLRAIRRTSRSSRGNPGFEGVACIDDAARLLDVLCDVWTRTRDPAIERWARGLLEFVLWMQGPDGRWLELRLRLARHPQRGRHHVVDRRELLARASPVGREQRVAHVRRRARPVGHASRARPCRHAAGPLRRASGPPARRPPPAGARPVRGHRAGRATMGARHRRLPHRRPPHEQPGRARRSAPVGPRAGRGARRGGPGARATTT